MWAGARSAASGRAQAKVACGRPDLIGPEVGQERGSLGHVWLSVGRGRRGSAGAFIVGMQWSCTCFFFLILKLISVFSLCFPPFSNFPHLFPIFMLLKVYLHFSDFHTLFKISFPLFSEILRFVKIISTFLDF